MSLISNHVEESLRIEGIYRSATQAELDEHSRFVQLPAVTVEDLEQFVQVYAPGRRLRERVGDDVQIGNYYPPAGGPSVRPALQKLLERVNMHHALRNPFLLHAEYETLHPFTDGNGRSGRALWYWMMQNSRPDRALAQLGFLHAWYYQSLRHLQQEVGK